MARTRALTALLLCAPLGWACTTLPPPEPTAAASAAPPPAPQIQVIPMAEPRVTWRTSPADADLWALLRDGFALPEVTHRRIDAQLRWYAGHPDYMARVARRARVYLPHIVAELRARDMPLDIALLPIVESAFDPYAYSHGSAAGLWQFIPDTGRRYGLDQDWWHDERRDVLESTRAALDYLQDLHGMFDGDWLLALAAYNSGPGNVRRALRRNRAKGRDSDFFALDLPRETEAYVPKLLALRDLVRDPQAHQLMLEPITDTPGFAVVDIGSQLDLAAAARLAQLDMDVLYRLNPALNRWATHPEGPHRLLVPVDHAAALRAGLDQLSASERVAWRRHRIQPGESLSTIATRYGLEVSTLRQANRLRGSMIRAGDALLIPTASAPRDSYALSASGRQAQREAADGEGSRRLAYRVRRGDSFWTIARAHGVGMHELASWNGKAVRDTLRIGEELVLWMPATVDVADAPPQREAITRQVGYRVRRGDSLARIAGRFGVSIGDIARWNTLDPAQYLQPGQRLKLFVDVAGGP